MRVRMRVDVSGTRDGQRWPPRGSVLDLPDDEAAHYCQVGMAEPVAVFRDAETATTPPVEERADGPLTTETGPARRGPGRPRKSSQPQGGEQ
jgi:hypothetical protein